MKFRGCQPGPLDYDPKNDLSHKLQKKISNPYFKPKVMQEGVYELVGGTSRVLRPSLLSKA